MLPESVKQEIKDAYQSIKSSLPNFIDRFQQRKMIAMVSSTLSGTTDNPITMIEGPTGTGKTMAYLLGAIPVAKYLEKPLVISSATIALQEQLLNKDIPLIQKYTDYTFDVRLAKGRGRYVCTTRLAQLSGNDNQGDMLNSDSIGVWSEPPDKQDIKIVNRLFKDLKDNHWSGDFDSCETSIPNHLWPKINNNFHFCTGSKCAEYNHCAFYRERRQLGSADIIIANHDLVLADIASGDGTVLPPIEDSLYIFDEAHHLPSKAINHFSANASVRGAADWIKSIPKAFIKEVSNASLKNTKKEIGPIAETLIIALQNLHQSLSNRIDCANEEHIRFPFGVPHPDIIEIGEQHIWPALKKLHQKMSIAMEIAKKDMDKDDADINTKEQQITALGFLFGRTENLYRLWQLMLRTDSKGEPPYARWMTCEKEDFILHVAPISAHTQLETTLWKETKGCVLTSATLTALNSFTRIQTLSGLSEDNAQFLRLPSPFDLTKVQLHIPKMQSTPKMPDQHTKEIVKMMPSLLEKKLGTLVLFSSRRQMEEVYQSLPLTLKKNIQVQGDGAREALLQTHQKQIHAQKSSTLFGLNSFAEGLDLAGTLCEHVVIAKLPFAVPTSPREEAYAEWIESTGKNAFFNIAVPDASMKLIQACGRLIRQEKDTGIITILDTRLTSTRYGKTMIEALPPYSMASND